MNDDKITIFIQTENETKMLGAPRMECKIAMVMNIEQLNKEW